MCNRIPSAEKRLLEGRLEVFIDGVKTNKHALHPKPGLITIRGARVSPKERREYVCLLLRFLSSTLVAHTA